MKEGFFFTKGKIDFFEDLNRNKRYKVTETNKLVKFINNRIEKKLIYGKKNYKKTLFIKYRYFKGDLDLKRFKFDGKVKFEFCYFEKHVDFDFSEFHDQIIFYQCVFLANISFMHAYFKANTIFSQLIFKGNVYFTFVTQLSHADFSECTFFHYAYFPHIKKIYNAYFNKTIFKGEVIFDGSIFYGKKKYDSLPEISFSEVTFENKVSFKRTKFNKSTIDFSKSNFNGMADFSNVDFNNELDKNKVTFELSEFYGETRFVNANFYSETNFKKVKFQKDTDFWEARFFYGVTFESTLFNRTYFDGCRFKNGEVNFNNIQVKDKITFSKFKSTESDEEMKDVFNTKTYFTNIHPTEDKSLIFKDISMKNIYFTNSYLDKMDFIHVVWEPKSTDNKINRKNRRLLYDEKNDVELKEIQRLYRDLRRNYEGKKDYEESELFYYSEMEIRKKIIEEKSQYKCGQYFNLLRFFQIFTGYGFSFKLPILWLVAFIFMFFPFLYSLTGLVINEKVIQGSLKGQLSNDQKIELKQKKLRKYLTVKNLFSKDYFRFLEYSFKVSFFRKSNTLTGRYPSLTVLINILQYVLTISLCGFAVWALRRRFRR